MRQLTAPSATTPAVPQSSYLCNTLAHYHYSDHLDRTQKDGFPFFFILFTALPHIFYGLSVYITVLLIRIRTPINLTRHTPENPTDITEITRLDLLPTPKKYESIEFLIKSQLIYGFQNPFPFFPLTPHDLYESQNSTPISGPIFIFTNN
jgi:hypothetical protein